MLTTTRSPYGIFSYPTTDSIGQHIAAGLFWDEHLRPWIDQVPPGTVMVDVGACLGFFTVYLAKKGVYVHAFEPCPEVFAILQQNVAQNGVGDHVFLHPEPLYSREGPLTVNTNCGWIYAQHPDG